MMNVGQSDRSTTNQSNGEAPIGINTVPGMAMGGSIAHSMDSFDRVKFNRALDKAPGTATTWVNENTRIRYIVTPIKKVTVRDNPFCREYQLVGVRDNRQQATSGTACVAADGAWSEVK